MSHGRSLLCAALVLVAATAGCPGTSYQTACTVEPVKLAGSSLTLLKDARLDRVGDGFFLLGSDGNNVSWASLTAAGHLGDEHTLAVPAHVDGPWLAMAGTAGAADHVLVAYTVAPAASGDTTADLMIISANADGTAPSAPLVVGQLPVGAALVSMGSGRGGMHAGLAWVAPATTVVGARIFDGAGQPVGADLALGTIGSTSSCLRFSPGRDDLTLGFLDLSGTPPAHAFVGTEINVQGTAGPSFRLSLGTKAAGCVELVATDTGYGLSWHNQDVAVMAGIFNSETDQMFILNQVRSDAQVSGGVQAVAGYGWVGKDYLVVIAHQSGAEAFSVNSMGGRTSGSVTFPSVNGFTGPLSGQPVGAAYYATYGDYMSAANLASGQGPGSRYFVKVTCQ